MKAIVQYIKDTFTAIYEMDDELRVVLLRLFDPALESLGA